MDFQILGKHGITGTMGLGVEGFFHLSAPYDSNGLVFVEYNFRYKYEKNGKTRIEVQPGWKRMTLKRAKREKRNIIRCCVCDKPAVSLDHLWPYDSYRNRCKKHYHSNSDKVAEKKVY